MSWAQHIRVLGQGSKALVLFHGWGFDNRVWLDIAARLQGRFSVYLVNLPGFGHSPLLPWEAFKESLLASLPQSFALLGWSMGGLYATRLAHEASTRVTQVINIGTSPYFMMDGDWPGIKAQAMQSFGEEVVRDPVVCLKRFMPTCRSHGSITGLSDASPTIPLPTLLAGLQILTQWDLRTQLSTLSCPIYYIFGQLDRIVPRTTYQVMKARYPHCQYLLLNGAAHDFFVSHQAELIHEIEGFIP